MRWKFWKKKRDEDLAPFPILFDRTQELIRSINQKIPGDFLSYWNSDQASIAHDDSLIIRQLQNGQDLGDQLHFFIRSFGGSGEAALRIVHFLRQCYPDISALVPLECASAATMLALGANRIHMGELAYLSAVDTSFSHELSPRNVFGYPTMISQNELDRVIDLWEKKRNTSDKNPYESLYEHIHPLVFGAVDRIRSLSIRLTKEILNYHMNDDAKTSIISDYLNSGYPVHGYPITFNEARRIGLPIEVIDPELEKQLLELNAIYGEMAQSVSKYNYSERHERYICSIVEREGVQYFFQKDTKVEFQHYTKKWQLINDESGWRKAKYDEEGEIAIDRVYIN